MTRGISQIDPRYPRVIREIRGNIWYKASASIREVQLFASPPGIMF